MSVTLFVLILHAFIVLIDIVNVKMEGCTKKNVFPYWLIAVNNDNFKKEERFL